MSNSDEESFVLFIGQFAQSLLLSSLFSHKTPRCPKSIRGEGTLTSGITKRVKVSYE